MFIISGRYFFLSTLFFRSWKIKLRTTLPCVEITSCRIGWADARPMRPYMQPNGYQQLTPCVPIAAILHAKMGDFIA